MKLYLLLLCSFMVLFSACSNPNRPTAVNEGDATIGETSLPKGKYVIEDDYSYNNVPKPGDESIKGYNDDNKTNENTTNTNKPELDLKRRYKNLLVFHADDTMKIKKAYIATLILAKDQVYGVLKDEVLENSNAKDEKVKNDTTLEIGSKMKAKLMDMSGATNKGFDIELIGEDAAEQTLTDKRKKLMWQWKLTPLTPGDQNLTLSIIVTEKNGDRVNLPVRSIPVVIFAEEESFGSKTMSFIEKNFQWLISALLIPVFIAWFGARMRHKFDSKSALTRTAKTDSPAEVQPQKDNNAQPIIKPSQNTEGSA